MSSENLAIIFAILFGISEVLGNVPSIKANSIFQMIKSILASLAGKNPDGSPKQ